MVRIALIGAAVIAAVSAVPLMPIEILPTQVGEPMMTGHPHVPFPEGTKTGKPHHHTPTPHHHTPHSPHHTPGATPRPHHEGGEGSHHEGPEGSHHLPKMPTHILPRWLAPRAEPEHEGAKPTATGKHNPQFPEHSGKPHHGHHTPTPGAHHGHHTPTPGAHHGHESGAHSHEIPMPTGAPTLPFKGPMPSGIHHPEPLTAGGPMPTGFPEPRIGTPEMAGGH